MKLKTLWKVTAVVAALGATAAARSEASAQTATNPTLDLRPLYLTPDDAAQGKELAEATCAKCHGADGVSPKSAVPNLAGQRPVYVFKVARLFQLGAQPDRVPTHDMQLMKFFTEDALAKVAAYYGSLEPASLPSGEAPGYVDPVAAGKRLAEPCAKCHGDGGISHKAGVPSLVGSHTKYLVETMKSYQSGDRPVDEKTKDMKALLDKLSDDDLTRIALYYSLQSENLSRAQTPSEPGAPPTKESLAVCAKCHGEDGVSTAPITPSIAGQDYQYMINAIHAYKDGTRDDDTMGPRAKKLDDAAIKNFAAYYSGLQPKPYGVLKPLSPVEWADKCDRCHGPGGNSMRVEVPALAGQKQDYLEKVLRAYQAGARTSPEMTAMASGLTEDDIKALAAHYAYSKPRAVVYVTVPSK